jgi:hypothetical protein
VRISNRMKSCLVVSMGLIVASLLVLGCRPDSSASSQLNGDGLGPDDPEICLLPDDVTLERVQTRPYTESASNPTPTERRAASRWMRRAASVTKLCSDAEIRNVRNWLEFEFKANQESQGMALLGAGGNGLCSKTADGRRMVAYMIGSTGYILARSSGTAGLKFSYSGTTPNVLCARLELMFSEG